MNPRERRCEVSIIIPQALCRDDGAGTYQISNQGWRLLSHQRN